MADKSLAVGEIKPPMKVRVKAFLKRNCMPTLVEDIRTLRAAKAGGAAVGGKDYAKAVGKFAGRVAASAAVHVGLISTVGVTALQTEVGAPSTKWLSESSSPVAKAIVPFVAGLIPPHARTMWGNILLGVDYALSAVRIGVEQALWKYAKITPDAPGTVVSPLIVGAGEMVYKTMALANTPESPEMRLAQGISGVYGNLVRFVGVGIIALSAFVWKKRSKPEDAGKSAPQIPN